VAHRPKGVEPAHRQPPLDIAAAHTQRDLLSAIAEDYAASTSITSASEKCASHPGASFYHALGKLPPPYRRARAMEYSPALERCAALARCESIT